MAGNGKKKMTYSKTTKKVGGRKGMIGNTAKKSKTKMSKRKGKMSY